MSAPAHRTPTQLVAERDNYREALQEQIRRRPSFTDRELAALKAVGVSFDPQSRQLRLAPVNGTASDLAAECHAYEQALLALVGEENFTFTAEELRDMEASGTTLQDLIADVNVRVTNRRRQRNGS